MQADLYTGTVHRQELGREVPENSARTSAVKTGALQQHRSLSLDSPSAGPGQAIPIAAVGHDRVRAAGPPTHPGVPGRGRVVRY